MHEQAQWLKSHLADRHQEIATAHHAGADGFATCVALTQAMDEVIRTANTSLPFSSDTGVRVAVFALGGYGRIELCPQSDVDIMILCDTDSAKPPAEEYARALLHLLWDAGINLGHSVRTIDEAIGLHGRILDSWVSMLESRFVCGSEVLAASFYVALRQRAGSDEWFVNGVLAEAAVRHERYGSSVKLLEPNVKKSAGALRDIHTVLWLLKMREPGLIGAVGEFAPAIRLVLEASNADRDATEMRAAILAAEFLLRTRHEMHYVRQSLHDTLEYALQREVAEGLGFGVRSETESVETFMRQYYIHARSLYRLHQRVCEEFRAMIQPPRPVDKGELVGQCFVVHQERLSLAPHGPPLTNAIQLFEAFAYCAENDLDLDAPLRAAIERLAERITMDTGSSELSKLFGRILRSKNVARTLHAMNDLGVLGKYIPEFGELVAFFQHNVYHYFTADEHTLLAVAKVEQLREQSGVLHDVFRNVRRKDILYLAILLHDIAKPRGVPDHEITGVAMAEDILARLGMQDASPDVAFLVRNHLVMEQVAFRRNIHDPETIKEFTGRFAHPAQLDYLYLLTFADLSAVNINVWTDWKALLLQELYQRSAEVLRRNLRGMDVDAFHQSKHQTAVGALVEKLAATMPREHVERHLLGIKNDSYINLFTDEEIGHHIQRSANSEIVSTIFNHQEGFTEVTVIARDAPFALSKFCAVLAANDANIFDANIFTRDDGVIIDRFRVSDVSSRRHVEQDTCVKIASDLSRVMQGALDINHLFDAHKRKWKRRPQRPVNRNVREDVEFEDTQGYTIIDVYAPDALGLLYKITETISRLGLDIFFAKIATRMDGVVDAFYTLDRSGMKVDDLDRRETIRIEILQAVRTIREQELG